MSGNKKTMLIVMDGWGINNNPSVSAIAAANTPFVDSVKDKYASTTLLTHSEHVGLPFGQMGNSEVGHMNLGAGRIVWQDLLLIDKKIESKEFFVNEELLAIAQYANTNDKPIHLLGLVSDGGIHAHILHLKALLDFFKEKKVKNIFIHAFTDGRDTDPRSGYGFLKDIETYIDGTDARIASVCGRYFAMDRDKRWDRIKKAYDMLITGCNEADVAFSKASDVVSYYYDKDITDEFIPATALVVQGKPIATLQEGDAVLCFNFRTDRCREITTVLTQQDMPDFAMYAMSLYYVTMTNYDDKFVGVRNVYGKEILSHTLGEVLAQHNKTQLRVAETEKYPHVSFFFSGGREELFVGEDRILVPSPKVSTYDLQPEMSAPELAEKVVQFIRDNKPDFICLNFANTDMVGHTGVFLAAVKAVETVDMCVQKVVEEAMKHDYTIMLTADHGNADNMVNSDGSPNTAHSKNLVPLYCIDNKISRRMKPGKLADVAPTILSIMDLPIPKEMDGEILFY
jgi:2,3-bisphosphoglycerate-independent phosphoglycerate mutase